MPKILSTATTTLAIVSHNVYSTVPGFWIVPTIQEGPNTKYPAYFCSEGKAQCFGDLIVDNNLKCGDAEKMAQYINDTVKFEYGTIWLVLDPRKSDTSSCKAQQAAIVAIKLDKYANASMPTSFRNWETSDIPENGTTQSRICYDDTMLKGTYYWSLMDAINAARAIADDIAAIIKTYCDEIEYNESVKLGEAQKVFDKLHAFLGQRTSEQQKEAEEAKKEAEKVAKLDAEWNELSTTDKAIILKQHKASLLTQPTPKRGRPPKTDKKVQPLTVTLRRGRPPKK